jgi:hypothetical protein
MTSLAVIPGTVVWLALAGAVIVWLFAIALASGVLPGPRRVLRWLLGSWLSRAVILAAWGAAGWHVFCQRP